MKFEEVLQAFRAGKDIFYMAPDNYEYKDK